MDTLYEGLYTVWLCVRQFFLNWTTFRQVLEDGKRNISCSLTSVENCVLDDIIDIMC